MNLLLGGYGRLGMELQKHLVCDTPTRQEYDITKNVTFSTTYDNVILSAAFTDVPRAEINRLDVINTNIIGTKNIAERYFRSRIVYISTDYVYEGKYGNYKESDLPKPFNFYGFSKLAGEAFMNLDKDLVIRTSFKPMNKWAFDAAFSDIYTSADYVDILAKDIAIVIKSDITGIINVGTERKSIYDLAIRRNPNVGRMSKNSIKTVNLPEDISMDISKLLIIKNKYGGS